MMRTFVLASILVLAVLADAASFHSDIDWSTIRPGHERLNLPAPIKEKLAADFEQFKGRIVGGVESEPNSIPFQVALILTAAAGTFFCGGSLISQTRVLTAAHCLDGIVQVQVILGAHQVQVIEPTQIRFFTSTFLQHPAWNANTLTNDVGIIVLPESVSLNAEIQLVALPRHQDVGNTFNGAAARVSGWGLDSDSATAISPVLRHVFVNVISNLICNIQFLGAIQSTHICTSGSGGVGACSGDSGGPLVIGNTQIGIVSFGLAIGCEVGWPSVFTRTTNFIDWIAANSDVTIFP